MNAENNTFACASSDGEMQWHQIDWSHAHRNVRRLQARIVKATKEGRWGKVKALQWLLTHSLSGKAIAVKQVTENQGKKTPGVDGETWSTPEAKTHGRKVTATTWLPTQTTAKGLHSEVQWKKETAWHSYDEGSSYASTLSAGNRSSI